MNIEDAIRYDKDTGGLYSLVDYYGWRKGFRIDRKAVDGYRGITFQGKDFLAHRLAFYLVEEAWPPEDVDHINMIRHDNRWKNLRKCSRSDNMKNTLAHSDSKTGHKGVSFRTDTNKYTVRITLNGKYKSLGCYDTLEEAVNVANKAREDGHNEFCNNEVRDATID